MQTMTRPEHSPRPAACMFLAFELGERRWKVGFTAGFGPRPRVRQLPARAVAVLAVEIQRAKARLGLPATAPDVRVARGDPDSGQGGVGPGFPRSSRSAP